MKVAKEPKNSGQVSSNTNKCTCASLNTNNINDLNILVSDDMDTRFLKIMRGLVVYKLGLMLVEDINISNKAEILQVLTIHDHPIILKIAKHSRFWLYLPQPNKTGCYFRPLSLKQSQNNTLQDYWQQHELNKNNPYKFLNEPTLATVQINNIIINVAQSAEIRLDQFKPLEDGRYYSLVLLILPGFASMTQEEQLKLIHPYQTDTRHYPNAIIVQDSKNVIKKREFWFYYAFPRDESQEKLRVLPVDKKEQQTLRDFFDAQVGKHTYVTITHPDAATQAIDNIVLRYIPAYSLPLLSYLGIKFAGYTDGFLAGKAYAILGPRYMYKARLYSFDLSFLEMSEFDLAKPLALKGLLPALIKDNQQQFWFCYATETAAAPMVKKFFNLTTNELAFLNGMFNSCKKNELLIAMEVNRMSVTIEGESIPGIALYNLIAKYADYTRAQDDYQWYFYELFGDAVGGELARYLLGKAAPKNQLVSIPYAAPGLISELFEGDFITFAEMPAVIAGLGATVLYPAAAERFRQLFLAVAPNTPLATLSTTAQRALIAQFILEQENMAEVGAVTLFLSDSDNKPANGGLLLHELKALAARIDFGCTIAHLHDFIAVIENVFQDVLYTELLYAESFRRALVKLVNANMAQLGAIVATSTARFIHAWDGIKLSAETQAKFSAHLGLSKPQALMQGFIDAGGAVRYKLGCTRKLSATIIQALKLRQGILKQYVQILEHAPIFRALQQGSNKMVAFIHNWQLDSVFMSFASSNKAAALITPHKAVQLAKALQFIEIKCYRAISLTAEQNYLLTKLIHCTYYGALKLVAQALEFETINYEARQKYKLLLAKLDRYPTKIALQLRAELLAIAAQCLCQSVMTVAQRGPATSKHGLLIVASLPFSINDLLQPKLKNSLEPLENLVTSEAKSVAPGHGVLALLQVGSLKPQLIVLPGTSSLITSNKPFLLKTIELENNSLLDDDYSSFLKNFNAATNLTLTGNEFLLASSEPASILLQLCLAVANGNTHLTKTLSTKLLRKIATNPHLSIAWQEWLLLPLHVAVIKNTGIILAYLIGTLRGYVINVNAAVGQPRYKFALLERAMMINNTTMVEFLVDDFIIKNIPFKLIDVTGINNAKHDYCMGLKPCGNYNEDYLKLLDSLMPYALQLSHQNQEVLLRLAAYLNNSKYARQLIRMQTDINAPDGYGQTPLHLAALNGSAACIELLLIHGANPYAQDCLLHTPCNIIGQSFNSKRCISICRQFDIDYQNLLAPINSSAHRLRATKKIELAIMHNKPNEIVQLIETIFYENPAMLDPVMRSLKNSSIKKLPLNAKASHHAGKTILWYLARVAMFGYPEALNRVISQLEEADIIDLELNAAPTEGDEPGITVLWLLAFNLNQGQAGTLNKILEILTKKGVNQLNFNAAAQQGTFKGYSVLYLLIIAAVNKGYREILEIILKKISEEKTRELELNSAIEGGYDRGRTILWELACAATRGYPTPLLIILNKLAVIPTAYLEAKAETGEYKGITVLWLLACAAINGYPTPLLIILNKLAAIPATYLEAKAETGEDKGITALWLLAAAALYDEKLALELEHMILRFNAAGRKSLDLNAAPENNKAQTVLLMLAFAMAKGHNRILETIIVDHKEKISSLKLNDVPHGIDERGATGLWALAYAAISGYPLALETVLEALPSSEIRKLDLNVAATARTPQNWQGKTVLWLLLEKKIANPHSTVLDKIIELLINKQGIKAHNLHATITRGENKGKTVLWLLVHAAVNENKAILEKIVSKLKNEEVQMLKLHANVPINYMMTLNEIKNAYLPKSILFKPKNIMKGAHGGNLIGGQNTQQISNNVANNGEKQYNRPIC